MMRIDIVVLVLLLGGRWLLVEQTRADLSFHILTPRRFVMKWTGVYLIGYAILIGGLLAALWKMGVLASIGTAWTLISIMITIGIGIMLAVSNNSGKEKIEISRK